MKLVIATACLLASITLATHALADGRTVVTLQQPLAAKKEFVVAGGVWKCESATCVASYTPDQTFGVSQCRSVALKAGPVADFKDETSALQPTQLDRCNAGLVKTSVATAAH